MKKYLVIIAFAFIASPVYAQTYPYAVTVPTYTGPSYTSTYTSPTFTSPSQFSNDLSIGSSGNDVSRLQTWLISRGFDIPAISSGRTGQGYYGTQTAQAVAAFQISIGQQATGFFGPATRAIANSMVNGGSGYSITQYPTPITQYPTPIIQYPIPVQTQLVTVLSPNGGEQLTQGMNTYISWSTNSSYYQNVTIYLVQNNQQYIIASNVSNTGSYTWNVGSYPDGYYTIRVCVGQAFDTSSCDSSNAGFRIVPSNVSGGAGPLRITSPNGGENFQRGTVRNITWTSPYYIVATNANLNLVRYAPCTTTICPMIAYAPYPIASNISINQNSYPWNVGYTLSSTIPDGQYLIQICDTSGTNCDVSDSPFTIQSGGFIAYPYY